MMTTYIVNEDFVTSSVDKISETFKGDNLMKIMNTIMQTMYEYVKHQDCIRYNSLYKMSKR